MNNVILIGRLTADPDMYYGKEDLTIAKFTLAVDRAYEKDTADFIRVAAFNKNALFAEEYLQKGMKIALKGHIQTGSYDKDGKTVYTTEVIVDRMEFCESKKKDDKSRKARR